MNIVKQFRSFSVFAKLEAELIRIEKIQPKEQILAFQREWKQLRDQQRREPPRIYNDRLSETQQKMMTLMVKYIQQLNQNELRYLYEVVKIKAASKPNFDEDVTMAITEEDLKAINYSYWPGSHPQWIQQQEIIAKLWPLGQEGMKKLFTEVIGFEAAEGSTIQDQSGEQGQQEQAVETPKAAEKTNFDVELSGIDAAQKIKIIKEVRQIFNLGLKEAKDLVDKVPSTLAKQMKIEDANKLKEKLEGLGCTINLI